MASNGYVDRSAMGEAPLGNPPQGQSAGASWPGGVNVPRSSANPNPSRPDMRMDALYATIERNDLKCEAGEKMMKQVKNGGRM